VQPVEALPLLLAARVRVGDLHGARRVPPLLDLLRADDDVHRRSRVGEVHGPVGDDGEREELDGADREALAVELVEQAQARHAEALLVVAPADQVATVLPPPGTSPERSAAIVGGASWASTPVSRAAWTSTWAPCQPSWAAATSITAASAATAGTADLRFRQMRATVQPVATARGTAVAHSHRRR
jgi:hypothetical protein